MRPLRLTIEGFTAFREQQEIDFESLGLFVITGPTGAGKTSILDAMVFALYGQVPRLGGKHGTADLVSLGRTQARVSFEFSLAGKGRYRVARRLSRRSAQTATVERLEGETWVSACERDGVRECDRVLGELLGIDFDGFCKAVVLPQGEFHRFLKGDANERRRVLISLLGINHFQRMAELARARRTRLSSGVERAEEILAEQYASATAEHLHEAEQAERQAANRAVAVSEAFAQAEQYQADVALHAARAEALAARADELHDVAEDLVEQVDACRAAEAAKEDAGGRCEAAADEVAAARDAVAEADDAAKTVERCVGSLDDLARAAAAADTLRDATAQEAQAAQELDDAETAEAHARDAASTAQRLEAEHEPAVVAARHAEDQADAAAAVARREADALDTALRDARRLAQDVAGARDDAAAKRTSAQDAAVAAADANAARDSAVEYLEDHRRAHAVAELSTGLKAGDPCPVCTMILEGPVAVAAEATDGFDAARTAAAHATTAAEEAGRQAAKAEADAEAAEQRERDLGEALRAALGEYGTVHDLNAAADHATEDLRRAETALGEARARRAEAEQRQRELGDARMKALGEVTRCEALTAAARRRLDDLHQRSDAAEALIAARFDGTVPADAGEHIAADRAQLLAALERAREARDTLDTAVVAHGQAQDDLTRADQRLSEIDITLARLRTRAEAAGAAAVELLDDGDQVGPSPDATTTRDESARALAAWCQALRGDATAAADASQRARSDAEELIVGLAVTHELVADYDAGALAALRGAERSTHEAAVKAQGAVEEARRRLDERRGIEQQVADEREQISVLDMLATELRADRFLEYLVQATLGILAVQASQELVRISDGRYSLVPDEGDFLVVDHANADERRSVKTLSGGETFLASLALALALSRHVGELASERLAARLEAVFIDEGFGTLDPETLEEVIDALERLRAEDLVVGVISHVPELAQRIRTGLEVHKDQGRSHITVNTGA